MRSCLAFLIGAALTVVPAAGQDPASTIDDEVVVTTTLTDESAAASAATVRVVDRETIEARQSSEVVDLLRTVPGLTVAQSGGPGQQASLFVRGTESDQSLVLWNGVPLNNPFFGGFNWAFLPTEGVERVEVVPGPFSALYGSNAAAGVVQVVARSTPGIRGRIEGADDGSWRAAGSGAGATERFAWDASGHVGRFDTDLVNDEYDSAELSGRLAWTPRRGLLAVHARYNDSETGVPFSGGQPTDRRRIDWTETTLAVPGHVTGRDWRVEGLLSRVDYESDFEDPDDPFGFTESQTESSATRARGVASFDLDGPLELAGGADWERLEATDRSSFGTNLDGADQSTSALFGQASWRSDRWTADVGLRWDDNSDFGSHTSPRLGLAFAATSGLRLRASYGEGFRAPSLGELFFPFSGNPDLRPETNESFEVGLRWGRGGWSLDLAGFQNDLTDLIEFDFATFANVNVGRARTRGVEAEAGWASRTARVRVAGAWLEADNLDTGQPLLRRPEWSASAEASFRPGAWTTNVLLLWVDDRPDIDPATFERTVNPSYTRIDVAGRWSGWSWVEPYARIENLTDEAYEEALGFPAVGRRFVLGVAFSG